MKNSAKEGPHQTTHLIQYDHFTETSKSEVAEISVGICFQSYISEYHVVNYEQMLKRN